MENKDEKITKNDQENDNLEDKPSAKNGKNLSSLNSGLTNIKTIATVLLIVIAILFAYFIFSNKKLEIKTGDQVAPEVFIQELSDAEKVYILQDLRGADATVRKNIQQCGIDFAGSTGLVGKNLTIIALDDKECTTLEGIKSVKFCIDEVENAKAVFHIKKSNKTVFYNHIAVVGIDANYTARACDINIKQPESVPSENITNVLEEFPWLDNTSVINTSIPENTDIVGGLLNETIE